jgi:SAM-dependent methyltransferase
VAEVESPYTDAFYDDQVKVSLRSASLMLQPLAAIWRPSSVVDAGCGRGTWLAAWERLGVQALTGLDGPWVDPSKLVSERIDFHQIDLNQPFGLAKTYDLAMSLEVAEHCRPESSASFVESLASISGAIVFGAAYTGQPGVDHINTRPHSFWQRQFRERGYEIFDYFRPKFWGVEKVAPWYQQNTFIYARPEHPLFAALLTHGERPMENPAFIDAVHPWLYDKKRGAV